MKARVGAGACASLRVSCAPVGPPIACPLRYDVVRDAIVRVYERANVTPPPRRSRDTRCATRSAPSWRRWACR